MNPARDNRRVAGKIKYRGGFEMQDFARTFPPERPTPAKYVTNHPGLLQPALHLYVCFSVSKRGILLYNLLRPELVKRCKQPLSPGY